MQSRVRQGLAKTDLPASNPDPIPEGEQEVVQAIRAFRQEAENNRRHRMWMNRRNRDAYMGQQDYSAKIDGQSTEFVPKTSETVDQFAAIFKKALTQFGDWFSIKMGKHSPISDRTAREILKFYLERLPDGDTTTNFATRLSDAAKSALLEGLMIFKVHGYRMPAYQYRVVDMADEKGQKKDPRVERVKSMPFRLSVDLIPWEDYKPDPTGRKLYKIHTVERDWHEVVQMAKAGVYDEAAVKAIDADFRRQEEERRLQGITESKYRRHMVVDEFWGTLLDAQGRISHETVLAAIANDKFLIRKPEPYPYWTGEDPFVAAPLIRVPHTVFHRAVMDEVVSLNHALNELFNLMLDGGIASVWGVRQVRADLLDDPTQISNGIPQNKTLVLREGVPEGIMAVEQIVTGNVPPEALQMYSLLEKELQAAAKTNDIMLGNLPTQNVKATAVAEASNASSAMMDGIASDAERCIETILWKAWTLLIQNADFLLESDLTELMTKQEVLALAQLSPAERFAALCNGAKFRVYGLSATLAKARDFQKVMALLQVAAQNPIMFRAMLMRVDGLRLWDRVIKLLNLNPEDFERDPDVDAGPEIKNTMALMQSMAGGGGPGGALSGMPASNQSTGMTGEPGMPSEINQTAQPSQVT